MLFMHKQCKNPCEFFIKDMIGFEIYTKRSTFYKLRLLTYGSLFCILF